MFVHTVFCQRHGRVGQKIAASCTMPMPKARRSHIIEVEHVVIETARLVSVGDFEMDVARTGLRMDSL